MENNYIDNELQNTISDIRRIKEDSKERTTEKHDELINRTISACYRMQDEINDKLQRLGLPQLNVVDEYELNIKYDCFDNFEKEFENILEEKCEDVIRRNTSYSERIEEEGLEENSPSYILSQIFDDDIEEEKVDKRKYVDHSKDSVQRTTDGMQDEFISKTIVNLEDRNCNESFQEQIINGILAHLHYRFSQINGKVEENLEEIINSEFNTVNRDIKDRLENYYKSFDNLNCDKDSLESMKKDIGDYILNEVTHDFKEKNNGKSKDDDDDMSLPTDGIF